MQLVISANKIAYKLREVAEERSSDLADLHDSITQHQLEAQHANELSELSAELDSLADKLRHLALPTQHASEVPEMSAQLNSLADKLRHLASPTPKAWWVFFLYYKVHLAHIIRLCCKNVPVLATYLQILMYIG